MIRRQLLRQLRVSSHTVSQRPLIQRSSFSSLSPISSRVVPASVTRIPRRWQSTETEKTPEEPGTSSAPAPESASPEASLKDEIEKKNKEIIDLKDKYLRSVADYRNLQDRMKREQDSARQFGIQRFATDLLDSIDNLDRALSAVPQESITPSDSSIEANKDLVSLHGGLKMTEGILLSTLQKHGLERFDPLEGEGRKFDPNQDEATFFAKQEGKQDGDVFFTQSKGFKLNGRVIRAAKVGVVKNS